MHIRASSLTPRRLIGTLLLAALCGCGTGMSDSGQQSSDQGGSGKTTTSGTTTSASPVLHESEAASAAGGVKAAIFFLDGRDINPGWAPAYGSAASRQVDQSGTCMIGGTYGVTGTESTQGAINPDFKRDYTWTFTKCNHASTYGNFVVDGTVHEVEAMVAEAPPSTVIASELTTFTSTSATVTGKTAGQEVVDGLVESCALQLDMSWTNGDFVGGGGSLCAVSFLYAQ